MALGRIGWRTLNSTRIMLPADVPPGDAVTLESIVELPDASGAYAIKIDLVNEGICWFEEHGNRPLYVQC